MTVEKQYVGIWFELYQIFIKLFNDGISCCNSGLSGEGKRAKGHFRYLYMLQEVHEIVCGDGGFGFV